MTANDLRIFFSQRGNWLGLFLLPVLFTLGLGFAFGGSSGPQTLRVDVVDEDGSAASRRFLEQLAEANNALVLCPPQDESGQDESKDRCQLAEGPLTQALAIKRVRDGDSAALIVIPADFDEAVTTLKAAKISFYSTTPPTSPDAVRETVDALLQRVNSSALTAGIADAILARAGDVSGAAAAIDPWRASFVREVYSKTETLTEASPPAVRYVAVGGKSRNESLQGFSQSVPGVGAMYVMFTVLGGMVVFQRDRQRWTLQRLGVFPLARGQILGGKILAYFILGMLQYSVVFGVGLAVGLDFGPQPLLVVPTMAAFVLCITAVTFAIAPALRSEGQAGVMTQLLALTFAALGGAWWPLEIVPEFMQRIGHLTPVAWVMDAFRQLLFYGGGLVAIAPDLGILCAAAAVLFVVGIWRFRYM